MNTIRKELQIKNVLLGFCLSYPVPGIIERVASDWDWIWIDSQHGQHDYNSILECVRACKLAGKPSVIRVPSNDYGSIGQALDTAASGIMVPMINTVEEAAAAVKAAKFAPIGNRSYGGRRPIDMYGRSYAHTANEDTCLILQIETLEGLANVDEIASVPGFDVLFFGPDDIAMQLEIPMDKPRKVDFFRIEMEKISLAAQKAGVLVGSMTASPEIFDIAVKMGYKLCVGTNDVSLLAGGIEEFKRKSFHG